MIYYFISIPIVYVIIIILAKSLDNSRRGLGHMAWWLFIAITYPVLLPLFLLDVITTYVAEKINLARNP